MALDLSIFNAAQRAAIEHGDGPALVLAGAGSGKTAVLTTRIAHLVEERGVEPDRILATTFTKKAAIEMRDRLMQLCPPAAIEATIGTFHSICLRILREEGARTGRRFDLLRSPEALIKDILSQKRRDGRPGLNSDLDPKSVLGHISWAKNQGALLGEPEAAGIIAERCGGLRHPITQKTLQAWNVYETDKQATGQIDFDDMLILTLRLLQGDEPTARRWQGMWDYFLVDETQDTNAVQYNIASILAERHQNLFVVGDDAQSIYAFRGARPDLFLQFLDAYPAARLYKLVTNYRCVPAVLEAANRLIANNPVPEQYRKELTAARTEPFTISYRHDDTADDEAEAFGSEVQELRQSGASWKDIAVLVRTNAQTRAIEDVCLRAGYPYILASGTGFYDRREVRDLLAYCRLVLSPETTPLEDGLARVVNVPTNRFPKPTHYLGRQFLQELEVAGGWQALTTHTWKQFQNSGIADFLELLQLAAAAGPAPAMIIHAARTNGYEKFLRHEDGIADDDPDNPRLENMTELERIAGKFVDLKSFLEHVDDLRSRQKSVDEKADAIVISTIHRAKGLEWPAVFVVGLTEGLLPHKKSMDNETATAEERRLCYVAVTRARDRLYCSSINDMNGQPNVSRFVAEMGLQPPEESTEQEGPVAPPASPEPSSPPAQPATWRYQGKREEADQAYCHRFHVDQAPEPIQALGGAWAYPVVRVAA